MILENFEFIYLWKNILPKCNKFIGNNVEVEKW